MIVEIQKRSGVNQAYSIASPFVALALTIVAGVIMFALLNKNPVSAIHTYFVLPVIDPWLREQIIVKATPLILIATGLCICFRANNWNIGAEGQYLIGGMVGSVVPVYFVEWDSYAVLPIMMLAGMIGGAAYASIVAMLKTRFNTNEILTSLMLVYVAQQGVDWVVRGPWRDPKGFGFPGTKTFGESAVLPAVSGDIHLGIIFGIVAAVVMWIMMNKTIIGFQINVTGETTKAAKFAGFNPTKTTFVVFVISGSLAGLAGIAEVSGSVEKLDDKLSLGYGFAAIIVAFLARLNPINTIIAGLILALSYIGGEEAQITLGISDRATRVFQGLLLFFVLACDTFVHYQIRIKKFGKAGA